MKNIWLISYNLDGVTAGPSIRFQRYAPFFEQRGYRLVFITIRQNRDLPEKESRPDFDILRIKASFPIFHHTLFLAKGFLKAIFSKNKPAAVMTFGVTTFHLWLLPLIKLRGIKLIYINTMSLHHTYMSGRGPLTNLYNKIHHGLYSILYRRLTAVVNSSTALTAGFLRHGVPPSKLKVIYNGVNHERFKPAGEAQQRNARTKLNLPETGKIILFVGLKVERKGIIDLLNSWRIFHREMPEPWLLLVGDEKTSASDSNFNTQWENIKKEIEDPSLRVINRPGLSTIEEYFQAADAFIFLSKKEGMPNVVLEAMASGLPMILTEFEGFSDDYGSDGKEYLLVKRDAEVIATAIQKLCSDPELYQSIRQNALQRIENYFLVEKSIDQYTQLFDPAI